MNIKNPKHSFGLLANGSSRCWDVAIDEGLNDNDEWIGEIEGPQVYITFQLKDINVVSEVIAYLGRCPNENSTSPKDFSKRPIVLGKFGSAAVSIVWDNEGLGRCFLVVGANARSTIRYTLFEDDIRMLKEAFCEVQSDL